MNRWVPAFKLTGIGFYIVTCIVGGTLVGWWLGGKRPVFIIVGLVVGLVLAVYGVYRMIRPFMEDNKHKENGE
jgi:ATP synthase protein I